MFCKNCGSKITAAGVCPKCSEAMIGTTNTKSKRKLDKGLIAGAVLCTVIAVAAVTVCVLNSKPYLYHVASVCLEEGEYERAEKIFSRIMNYKDSEALLAKTWYYHTNECMKEEKYDLALKLMENYEDSVTFKPVAEEEFQSYREQIADSFRQQERYEDALELYKKLGKIWKSAETSAATEDYIQAVSLLKEYECNEEQKKLRESWRRAQIIRYVEKRSYEEAAEWLGDYEGAYDEEFCPYVYQTARNSADNKKYEEALEFVSKIPKANYTDETKNLLVECSEVMGIACAGEKNYQEAWDYFRACDGRVTEAGWPALYETGQFLMDQESYTDAYSVWNILKDYQDGAERLKECCRLRGRELVEAGKYADAISIYKECDEEELVADAIYYWAKDAVRKEDFNLTVQKLQELGAYENSDRVRYRYDLAGYAAQQTENPRILDFAVQLYIELGDYGDSAERAELVLVEAAEKNAKKEKIQRLMEIGGNWQTEGFRLELCILTSYAEPVFSYLQISMIYNEKAVFADGQGIMECGVWNTDFRGGKVESGAYGGGAKTVYKYNITYQFDECDYQDGYLYLGGWSYPCTVSGNTMTLKVGSKTLTLTK